MTLKPYYISSRKEVLMPHPDLALAPLPTELPTIADIVTLLADGPYPTKSDGELRVRFVMGRASLARFFAHDHREIARLPVPIEGLRQYDIRGLREDFKGGGEFHRIRQEIVIVTQGAVEWICEDLHGSYKTYTLHPGTGVWIPPFMLHSYRVIGPDTVLQVTANTIFFHPEDRGDTRTHDTYGADQFRTLQGRTHTSTR